MADYVGFLFFEGERCEIAQVVRKALEAGQVKIVYGNDSLKTWLGSNFVPLKWLNRIIWADMKASLNLDAYKGVNSRTSR